MATGVGIVTDQTEIWTSAPLSGNAEQTETWTSAPLPGNAEQTATWREEPVVHIQQARDEATTAKAKEEAKP